MKKTAQLIEDFCKPIIKRVDGEKPKIEIKLKRFLKQLESYKITNKLQKHIYFNILQLNRNEEA